MEMGKYQDWVRLVPGWEVTCSHSQVGVRSSSVVLHSSQTLGK
jgi:hypothetical protein